MSKRFCPHGHDTDIVGRTATARCKECHRESNRVRHRHNSERYRANRKRKHGPEQAVADAARAMRRNGGLVPAQRIRSKVSKDEAMHAWMAHWNVSKSAGYHAMLRLWENHRIDVDQADRWCCVLGTHLAIVYPEVYYEGENKAVMV